MQFMNFVFALSPLTVVLVGILGFKQPAKRVAPLALIWKGIKEGLKIVLMVFGAFVILNILRKTGAIEDVKATIAHISDDRRVQVIIIGLMLPIFLEGAAGAGSPAAIAAPFFGSSRI